jgi:nicotinamide-nucleotide amidase
MRACIVCLGDEVLAGQVINTNAAFLAKELTSLGFSVDQHVCISDFDPQNSALLDTLAKNYELIVCSGGLGPTVDDLTRPLLAKLSSCELVFNEAIYKELTEKFGSQIYHRLQAMVPQKAHLLKNATGTACGLLVKVHSCSIAALPGVPHELKVMFQSELVPYLKKHFDHLTKYHESFINFFDLLEVDIDPYIKQLQKKYPGVLFGIYPGYGVVRVVCKSQDEHATTICQNFLKQTFPHHVFSFKHEKIENALFEKVKIKKMTLACAESITGGEIASRLVSLPGVSENFLGSVVAYSNELKVDLLGVDKHVLKIYGAVSAEVCELMLSGVLSKTHADLAIAVTGIAGPDGGTEKKPVGLVYIGVMQRGKSCVIHTCHFKGDRSIIRETASTFAMGYLLQYLEKIS